MARKCKNKCGTEIPIVRLCEDIIQRKGFCGATCLIEVARAKQQAAAKKKAKSDQVKKDAEFKEMKVRVKSDRETIGKLKGILQGLTNKLAKIVNYRDDCISCGKDLANEKQVDGGHWIAVGQCDAMRFNMMQIFRQCTNCNNFLKGNQLEYERRLREIKGDEYVEYLLEQKLVASRTCGDKLWTKPALKVMIAWTRKELKSITS